MLKLINFVKSRPSDHTIKMLRFLFGLLLSALLGLGYMMYDFLPSFVSGISQDIVKITLIFLALLPVLWGLADLPLGKKKVVSYGISAFGLFWLIVGNMMEERTVPSYASSSTPNTASVSYRSLSQDGDAGFSLDIGFYVALLGFLILLFGWSGKFITSPHVKHGEKITKIRV